MSWRHAAMAVSLAVFTVSMATPALAQTWSDEQLEVWDVVQAQWQASMEEDATWPDRFLHESFLGGAISGRHHRTRKHSRRALLLLNIN